MTFIVQPATDLIVPLYRIATWSDQRQRQEETEKFFQATFRISLAAAMFFLHVLTEKVALTIPCSMAYLIEIFAQGATIYATTSVHPYAGLLAGAVHISRYAAKTLHPYPDANLIQLAGVVFLLYAASKEKPALSDYKLDQRISLLSKNLAAYFVTTPR